MVRGNVAALADQPGTLVVSSDARIDGEVQPPTSWSTARSTARCNATETLELQAGSKVKGDVYYKSIEIHQGGWSRKLVHHVADVKGVELKLASADELKRIQE